MNYNEKILIRKKNWINLINNVSSKKNTILINCPFDTKPRPFLLEDNAQERIDWGIADYLAQKQRTRWLDDDNIPHIWPYTGTEVFAEALGCKVHYSQNNAPFTLPLFTDPKQAARIEIPNMWDTKLASLFEMTEKMRAKTDKNAVVRLPDIQTPMNIAGRVLQKSAYCIALIKSPEYVRELAEKIMQLLTQFIDEWFKAFGKEFIAHYPAYYMPSGLSFSEDEIGSVTHDVFRNCFMDDLKTLAQKYGNLGIHCCANSEHQWKNLKSVPNLKVLNLYQPLPVLSKAYPYFKDVCIQLHNEYGRGKIRTWKNQLPENARIIFNISATSKDDALKKVMLLRECFG